MKKAIIIIFLFLAIATGIASFETYNYVGIILLVTSFICWCVVCVTYNHYQMDKELKSIYEDMLADEAINESKSLM